MIDRQTGADSKKKKKKKRQENGFKILFLSKARNKQASECNWCSRRKGEEEVGFKSDWADKVS